MRMHPTKPLQYIAMWMHPTKPLLYIAMWMHPTKPLLYIAMRVYPTKPLLYIAMRMHLVHANPLLVARGPLTNPPMSIAVQVVRIVHATPLSHPFFPQHFLQMQCKWCSLGRARNVHKHTLPPQAFCSCPQSLVQPVAQDSGHACFDQTASRFCSMALFSMMILDEGYAILCSTVTQDSGHVFRRDSKQPYEQELPDCFPPRFLFTCTVGRNRSKARWMHIILSSKHEMREETQAVWIRRANKTLLVWDFVHSPSGVWAWVWLCAGVHVQERIGGCTVSITRKSTGFGSLLMQQCGACSATRGTWPQNPDFPSAHALHGIHLPCKPQVLTPKCPCLCSHHSLLMRLLLTYRFALSAASEVSDLLDSIVQQVMCAYVRVRVRVCCVCARVRACVCVCVGVCVCARACQSSPALIRPFLYFSVVFARVGGVCVAGLSALVNSRPFKSARGLYPSQVFTRHSLGKKGLLAPAGTCRKPEISTGGGRGDFIEYVFPGAQDDEIF
eukprot:1157993-Pelagomonas_calceolata.AAC.4